MSKENGLKQYMGDGVYADLENGMIKLTTEEGSPNDPTNVIYLESSVFRNLKDYVKWLNKKLDEMHKNKTPIE